MQHRFADINNEAGPPDNEDDYAECIGGTNDADIWVGSNGVIICQYENDDAYVSYTRGDAVWLHATGVLTDENNPNIVGKGIKRSSPNAFWRGYDCEHNPKEILHYLMCFAPRVFSAKVRKQILQTMEKEDGAG